jgi:hypothetical protein
MIATVGLGSTATNASPNPSAERGGTSAGTATPCIPTGDSPEHAKLWVLAVDVGYD